MVKVKTKVVSPGDIDLEKIAKDINAEMKEELLKTGDDKVLSDVEEYIGTGCRVLDLVLGGGILLGRITEIYGEEGAGKSTLAIQIMAKAHQMGGYTIFIDSEASFDKKRAKGLGWDNRRNITVEAPFVERGFSCIMDTVKHMRDQNKDAPIVIVWDTLHAAPSEAAYSGDPNQDGIMNKPRIIQRYMRNLAHFLPIHRASLIVLNQLIAKMSTGPGYGPQTDSTGGWAMRHYPSHRIQLRVAGKIKDSRDDIVGINIKAKLTKSKRSIPFTELLMPMGFFSGIDSDMTTFEFLMSKGVFVQTGGWVKCPEYDSAFSIRRSDFIKTMQETETFKDYINSKLLSYFPGVTEK